MVAMESVVRMCHGDRTWLWRYLNQWSTNSDSTSASNTRTGTMKIREKANCFVFLSDVAVPSLPLGLSTAGR